MPALQHVTIEALDAAGTERFVASAFGLGERVHARESDAATTGFRGFTLSLVVEQPSTVDRLVDAALDEGATSPKPPAKSLWGYGAAVQAPDGTIWTLASSSKKDTGPATDQVDDLVLQLGVADVAASSRFYSDRGFTVAKSYGKRYVEFDTGPVTLALYKRGALAKLAGVPAEGSGSHCLVIGGDSEPFTDPDGYVWEST